jgi:hypothetical protein
VSLAHRTWAVIGQPIFQLPLIGNQVCPWRLDRHVLTRRSTCSLGTEAPVLSDRIYRAAARSVVVLFDKIG